MPDDLVIRNSTGHLRLRLLPPTKTAVARVTARCDTHNQGPLFNNARDLIAFADAIRDWCHQVAAELHPGAPLDPQGELFEEAR